MQRHLRYLAAMRLSADADGSTSIDWQRRVITHHVAAPHVEGILVGEAEDVDVSGSLSPFKRPKLGKWLTKRSDEFDVVISAKMDRLTRRSTHFNELLEWAKEHDKLIVCVEEGFDLSSHQGRMMARMTAVFAEAEWETIQARILNGVKTRLENRSWLVGDPPTGYKIKPVEGGKRKILEIDEDYLPVVEEIFKRISEGQSTHRIARDFNERGVKTWSDHLRELKQKEATGKTWQATVINKFIRSPWVAGIYTYQGEPVLDGDGNFTILPEKPLASLDDWTEMVAKIAPREKPEGETASRAGARSLLAGVARCGSCGARLASLKGSGHERKDGTKVPGRTYYRCTNKFKGGKCGPGTYVRADVLDTWLELTIRSTVGQWDVYERLQAGPSSARELESARLRLEKLESDYLAGEYDEPGQEESYRRMHKALSGKVAALQQQENERRNPTIKPTGKKYGEVWDAKDQEERREFLLTYGVKIWVWDEAVQGMKCGFVMDLGDIQTMREELGLVPDSQADFHLIGHNVPPHWTNPRILRDPEIAETLELVHGSTELPTVLAERFAKLES